MEAGEAVVTKPPPENGNRLMAQLTGIKFVVAYMAILGSVAFVLTLVQPGGPF